MKAAVTMAEITALTGRTKRAIELRAVRESWPYEERAARGGRQRLYPLDALPEDVRVLLTVRAAEEQFQQRGGAAAARQVHTLEVAGASPAPATTSRVPAPVALSPGQQRRAEARLAVVRACDDFVSKSSLARHSGTATFARLWNAGKYPAEDWVKVAVPALHANSIHAWRAKIAREGVAALGGKHGRHRKGSGLIDSTPELRDFIVGLLAAKPHVDAAQVMSGLRARFAGSKLPAYRSVQRFIKTWKDANAGIFLAVTDPDAHRSRLGVAVGSASEAITALNHVWEWDATPADVLCADGRHALVGVIDVWSRRAKIVVTPTSRATAITAVLRKAALDWGLPAAIKGDNGKDFTSFHVMRALADLDIRFIACPPYSPEKKPHIERFFQTLSHQFLELLPGYVGHDVAERQAIRNRTSFADRRRKAAAPKKAANEDRPVVEIPLPAAELQAKIDAWVETVYLHRHHAGVAMTPFARAASWKGAVRRIENPRAFDVLLAEAPDNKGLRTVGKKGLKVDAGLFMAPELGAHVGEQVMVRYDAADLGRVFVFAVADGRFVCEARCVERLGADRETVAAQAKAIQKTMLAEGRKALAQVARGAAAERVAEDILAAGARDASVVAAFPAPSVAHETPALAEALKAVVARDPRAPREFTPRERAMHEKVVADLTGQAPKPAPRPTPETRFARARAVEAAGEAASPEDREWLAGYRQTSEYRAQRRLFESFGEGFAAAG